MIPTARITAYLREVGYAFDHPTRRRNVWRRSGGTERVYVPRRKRVEFATAVAVLRSMGMSREAAQQIVQSWLDAASD